MKRVSWLKRRRWERQMHAEFQFHLENQVSEYMQQGLTREAAELRARRNFGVLELAKDECRDERAFEPLGQLLRDLRYALRSLRKAPGYAIAAILTLALGIGANTAIFSALEGVVLSPLPYHEPDRLVIVALYNRCLKYATYLSYPDFLDWQCDARSFEQIAAFTPTGYDLASPGSPEHVDGYGVSSGFLRTLGVSLAMGSSFSCGEDRLGGMPAAIISNGLWRERFQGNPAVVGKAITLNGAGYTIVGVLPAAFRFEDQPVDVFTPIGRRDSVFRNDRTVHSILCIARLRHEVSLGQAQAEMNTLQEHIDELNPHHRERGGNVYRPVEAKSCRRRWRDASTATRSCQLGFAHRLRERCEFVAGALSGTDTRICGSTGAGREPNANHPAIHHRECASVVRRRSSRTRRCQIWAQGDIGSSRKVCRASRTLA